MTDNPVDDDAGEVRRGSAGQISDAEDADVSAHVPDRQDPDPAGPQHDGGKGGMAMLDTAASYLPTPVKVRIQALQGQRQLLALASLSIFLLPGTVSVIGSLLLRVLGTALGIGLGLGLAAHVHDALDRMAGRHHRTSTQASSPIKAGGTRPRSIGAAGGVANDGDALAVAGVRNKASGGIDQLDDDSYHALMAGAGYDVPVGLLRGQILRHTSTAPFPANAAGAGGATGQPGQQLQSKDGSSSVPITAATILENTIQSGPNKGLVPNPLYPHSVPDAFANFASTPSPRGPSIMKRLYPTLPTNICTELGSFVDYIMRDFINSWFCLVDPAVLYEDEQERRDRVDKEEGERARRAEEDQKKEMERRRDEERRKRAMDVLEEGRKAIAGTTNRSDSIGSMAKGDGGESSRSIAPAVAAAAVADSACSLSSSSERSTSASELPSALPSPTAQPSSKRSTMVLSTAPLRPSPFPEALYTTMATLFGSLAMSARDNVNIMELFLIKLVHVLSLNIKTYRELRRVAVEKRRRKLACARGRVRKGQQSLRGSSGGASTSKLEALGDSSSERDIEQQGQRRIGHRIRSRRAARSEFAEWEAECGIPSSPIGDSDPVSSPSAAGTVDPGSGLPPSASTSSATTSSQLNEAQNPTTPHPLPSESEITEIAMIREYLLAGKFHRAITFGMDVPSLLFADPHGRDCPPPPPEDDEAYHLLSEKDAKGENIVEGSVSALNESSSSKGKNSHSTPTILEDDAVLHARLFSPKSQLLLESEQDYCRVLSHRLVKHTTSKVDFASPVLRSMAVEMIASCVLAPIMGCFSPEYINYGLKVVLEPYTKTASLEGGVVAPASSGEMERHMDDGEFDDDSLMRGWSDNQRSSVLQDEVDDSVSQNKERSVSVSSVSVSEETPAVVGDDTELLESRVESSDLLYNGEIAEEEDEDELSLVSDCRVEDGVVDDGSQNILPLLTMAIIELQAHLDFDDCKRALEHGEEVQVNWDSSSCRAAVGRLVLVVEAALLHGLRAHRKNIAHGNNKKSAGTDIADKGVDPGIAKVSIGELVDENFNEGEEEATPDDAAHLKPATISVLLMEMTSDLDSFEQRVAEEECDEMSNEEGDEGEEDPMLDSLPPILPTEISTLRTLIAAWLHTGQLYRTLSVFVKSRRTILQPFYHPNAFVRDAESAAGFVRQLRVLDGVDVLVDTTALLRCRGLDLGGDLHVDDAYSFLKESVDVSRGELGLGADVRETGSERGALQEGDASSLATMSHAQRSRRRQQHAGSGLQSLGGSLVGGVKANIRSNRQRLSRLVGADSAAMATTSIGVSDAQQSPSGTEASSSSTTTAAAAAIHSQLQSNVTPPHLVFSYNNAFASSLRLERERRMQSWTKVIEAVSLANRDGSRSGIDMICHTRGLTENDILIHRELHQLARALYSSTVVLSILEESFGRGGKAEQGIDTSLNNFSESDAVITMENVTNRRRFEVPDDDSSFLLRAQSRPLNPVGVHRDQRNHEQSFKCFVATYEERILHPKSKRYRGGRFIRRCLLRYYPSDRTASVAPMKDARRLDSRRARQELDEMPRTDSRRSLSSGGSGGSGTGASSEYLPTDFQKQRHLCNKHVQAGAGGASLAGSILTSTVMESADFSSTPRTGKAIDFVYRVSLFEKPVVDLGGKQFTVQDSSIMGMHRADASALEMSDAAISYALLTLGGASTSDIHSPLTESIGHEETVHHGNEGDPVAASPEDDNNEHHIGGVTLRQSEDGSPTMIWMKVKTSQASSGSKQEKNAGATAMKPIRPSFLRAALLVTSTRQEAQLKCLLSCVRSGSARNATKTRTEALLQPCLSLLEFAVSKKREKQSILLRDLKFGINHIDRDQLRRKRILYPRYPTILHSLSTSVVGAIKARSSGDLLGSPAMVLYKIKCVATIELTSSGDKVGSASQVSDINASGARYFREEWTVLRPFRDFLVLHKFLKSQVSQNESSGSAGAKIVGAATAAFSFGESTQRQRRALIPSLGQATKAGALGVTQKSVERRRDILNDYLSYLTDPNHMLNRCPEILRFLGACDALPSELSPGAPPDGLGRIDMKRIALSQEVVEDQLERTGLTRLDSSTTSYFGGAETDDKYGKQLSATAQAVTMQTGATTSQINKNEMVTPEKLGPGRETHEKAARSNEKRRGTSSLQRARWASIKAQVESVKLSQVRNGIFQFIRYQFDLDNASFFRSRIVSALKTMSFAVTSTQEFHKMLFQMQLQHASSEAMAGWIKFGRDIIWPEGVFFQPGPELSEDEKEAQEKEAKDMLMAIFPEQMRTLLGQEIAYDGLAVFHEMLNNRVVLKSMAYMLMDEAWLSLFPELRDVVSGTEVLESED